MLEYNIIDTLNNLNENAMFRLSLTSKELFHSNFWAWLIKKYPLKFTSIFYSKYDGHTIPQVLREKYNFDLLLIIENKFIIIENKFKSLPDKNQLDRYIEKANKQGWDNELVLVSYMPPSFPLKNFISYNDLYSHLSNIDLSDIQIQDKAIIENYIECIGLLIKLQKSDIFNTEILSEFWNKYNDEKLNEELKEINFGLTIQKIFMGKLVNFINKQTNRTSYISTGSSHVVYADFYGNNPEAFITLCCNGEYRYMFKINKDDTHNQKEDLIKFCDEKYGQFLSDKKCVTKRKNYNCFMGKECAWIYKKKNVEPNTSFNELANIINKDLIELDNM